MWTELNSGESVRGASVPHLEIDWHMLASSRASEVMSEGGQEDARSDHGIQRLNGDRAE